MIYHDDVVITNIMVITTALRQEQTHGCNKWTGEDPIQEGPSPSPPLRQRSGPALGEGCRSSPGLGQDSSVAVRCEGGGCLRVPRSLWK